MSKLSPSIILLIIISLLNNSRLSAQVHSIELESPLRSNRFIVNVSYEGTNKLILGGKKTLKIITFDNVSKKKVEEKIISSKSIKIKELRNYYINTFENEESIFLFYLDKLPSYNHAIKAIIVDKQNFSIKTFQSSTLDMSTVVLFSKKTKNSMRFFVQINDEIKVLDFDDQLNMTSTESNIMDEFQDRKLMEGPYFDLSEADSMEKIFVENNSAYLLTDDHEKNVSRIYRIKGDSVNAQKLEFKVPQLETKNGKLKFNSFYHNNKLYQLAFTKIEGAFSIFDLSSMKIVFEEKFKTFESISFSNTPKVTYTNLLNDKEKEKDDLPLMNKLYNHSPDLVINEENDSLKINLGAYYYYSHSHYSPNGSYTTVSTGEYKIGALFDHDGQHLKGKYKLNIESDLESFLKYESLNYHSSFRTDNGYMLIGIPEYSYEAKLYVKFIEN